MITHLRLVGAPEFKSAGDKETKDVETKTLAAFQIKDEEKGEVEAIIATLGVMDKDGDIIREDAIKSGAKVKMSAYGHDAMWGEMPVGKGVITVKDDKAVFKGNLFMSTVRGREVFGVLKEMGADQEWSFGFRVTGWESPSEDDRRKGVYRILTKLDPFEVSPVIRGAGVGTRTVTVKEEKEPELARATPPVDDPGPEPTPTPEELAAKAKAEQDAKDAADRATAEAKAASERAALERTTRAAEAVEDARSTLLRLRRLGYVS